MTTLGPRPVVAYYRVSTARQGASGLGLDAQRDAVARFTAGAPIIAEFEEVESGKNDDRPQLRAAMSEAKRWGAVLVIAKLDRLARSVHFISGLMRSGVDFKACDMPEASRLTVHMMAAFAEHEAEMISKRTKDALAAAKARGRSLGGNRGNLALANASRLELAIERRAVVKPYIKQARAAGARTYAEIAEALNMRGVRPPRGGTWSATTVRRVELAKD